ncbi:MAG: YbaB/EbfC family nucleoid-associated protein [Bdellovibrionales bacterium]|nr:YbaB/EbfC family nucleoid-associated protein [Bdellovibrionales bacterium]
MNKGKGGFGGGNMQAIMQQAKKMQEQLQKAQEKAKTIQEESSAGGGMVTVVANGENKIVSIKIKPAIAEDIEILQDTVLLAVNAALDKAQEKVQEELSKVTGGLNLPGMM